MTERQRIWLESAAFGALAAVPLVPALVFLARHPLGRFAVDGDYAGLELATRYAFTGRTLLGPYSRFMFNHPGPLYFFCVAPIYVLFGRSTTAFWAGAVTVNLIAAAITVVTVRVFAGRAQAIAAALTVLAWLAAFGNAAAQPWNPLIVVLPLLAFLVCAAQLSRGKSSVLATTVFLGAFVAETHLSTVPTVAFVLAAGLVGCLAAPVRRGGLTWPEGRAIAQACAVLALCLLPAVVEQVTSPVGNLTRIVHFFERAGRLKPFRLAFVQWMNATSWLPERLLHRALSHEDFFRVMSSDAVPQFASRFSIVVAAVWAIAVAGGAALAIRRRDDASIALLGAGVLASVVALFALRAVVGDAMFYLVFWTTAGSTVAWMGIATAIAGALPTVGRRLWPLAPRALVAVPVASVVLASVLATSTNWAWISRQNLASPHARVARGAYDALLARLRRTGETPVVHVEAAWYIALLLLNELARDGIEARVEPKDRWILGRQFPTPQDAPRPLHVYSRTNLERLDLAECLTLEAESGDVGILVSKTNVTSCPNHSSEP
ncbi:MAG TPA: hypothetical protein VEK07_24985 [Polyangiaceae bacterium]|nr:hypothetical protein [Polyangiaceae bacterium]